MGFLRELMLNNNRQWLLAVGCWLMAVGIYAQETAVVVNKQRSFPSTIPAGNYSGITWIGGNRYAVVNDKAAESGYHLFVIDIDSITGKIRHASEQGFFSCGLANRDEEGIAFFAPDSTLFISGEDDNEVLEYAMSGKLTGRRLQMPAIYKNAKRNKGLEALTYQSQTGLFYTVSEMPLQGDSLSRIQCFGNDLKPLYQWFYKISDPSPNMGKGKHTKGIPTLAALPDGRLLVMEREVFSPPKHIGSFVKNDLFVVTPREEDAGQLLEKQLVMSIKTKLNLTVRNFANYEGMCLGPRLVDGRQVLILICDSQNQYKGYLKDWLRTVILPYSLSEQK